MSRDRGAFLLAPLGLLLTGLAVLYLKGLETAAYSALAGALPYLGASIAEGAILLAILIRGRYDALPFGIALMLSAIGLLEIARLKPELLTAQARWLMVSLLLFFLVLTLWKRLKGFLAYPYILGALCAFVLALPLVFGTEIGGSRNWLVLGPFSVQPSELGKIIMIFFLASFLSEHRRVLTLPARRYGPLFLPPLRFIAPLILIWGVSVLMFVVERDLGSALLFFGLAILMTYMATGLKTYVFLALSFMGAAAAVSYAAFSHVRVRFDIWLDPWKDPSGSAYQVVQSLFSFATGGVWGTGFGYGQPGFIPEVHTDFIYAAIAEEWGLAAALVVLLLYVLLFWRGTKAALLLPTEKEMLLGAGLSLIFLLQAFIIIAGVTKFLPLTGITLPFVSYGGSSLTASFMELSLLLALSRGRDAHA